MTVIERIAYLQDRKENVDGIREIAENMFNIETGLLFGGPSRAYYD
jgi:hypothetical protein